MKPVTSHREWLWLQPGARGETPGEFHPPKPWTAPRPPGLGLVQGFPRRHRGQSGRFASPNLGANVWMGEHVTGTGPPQGSFRTLKSELCNFFMSHDVTFFGFFHHENLMTVGRLGTGPPCVTCGLSSSPPSTSFTSRGWDGSQVLAWLGLWAYQSALASSLAGQVVARSAASQGHPCGVRRASRGTPLQRLTAAAPRRGGAESAASCPLEQVGFKSPLPASR